MYADVHVLCAPVGLAIEIILNQPCLEVSNTLTAQAHITNDETPDAVEVKIWIELPDGGLYSIYNLSSYAVPANANVTVTVFNHHFTGGEPTGGYKFGGRFLNPITGEHISTDIEPFTFGVPCVACGYPVQESGIGSPGGTGWPFTLANIVTANYDGTIRKIGVDRWDKAGLTWDIYLWDISCSLIAHATVIGGTGWYYADITPWPVQAGDQFYIGYTVSDGAGSYIYRDTPSPVNVGSYTVEAANYSSVGVCPTDLNGYLVSPVDVEFCVEGDLPLEPNVLKRPVDIPTPVATDMLK